MRSAALFAIENPPKMRARLRERGAQTLSVAVVTYMTTVFVSPALIDSRLKPINWRSGIETGGLMAVA